MDKSATKSLPLSRAVFIDRDGVINFDSGYVYKVADLKILPGVPDALKRLRAAGFKLIMLTNQSGVARGMFTMQDVETFHQAMFAALAAEGAYLDASYICPHLPEGKVPAYSIVCECRKPGIQLITDAVREWNLDLTKSYLVGDKPSDVDCALAAGVQAVQVVSGTYRVHQGVGVLRVESLSEAADLITAFSSLSPLSASATKS